MKSHTIIGSGLGLYFGFFIIAALLGLPRLYTYLLASAIGAGTVGYAFYVYNWNVNRVHLARWQWLVGVFLGIVGISYFVNSEGYDISLTLKVVGYSSLFVVASLVALIGGPSSVRSCVLAYLTCLLLAMLVTLAVNNTNSNNHRLLGPTYKDGIQGSGLHHNEVGLLGMTAVMLATVGGWPMVLAVTPISTYTAYLSGSRGSLIGILIALAVFAVAKEFLSRSATRQLSTVPTRGVYRLAGSFGLSVLIAVFAGDFLIDDILQINNQKRGISSGFTGRADVWQGMVDDWKQSPVIGRGYGIVRGEASAQGIPVDGGFLLLMAELGLAGLLLFLLLIYHTFKVSWAGTVHCGDSESIALLVFVVTFSFINLFESRFVGTGSIGLGMFLYFASLCTLTTCSEHALTAPSTHRRQAGFARHPNHSTLS